MTRDKIVNLHPPKGEPKAVHLGGEPFVNVAGIMQMARENDTAECRDLCRFYAAEHRARVGQPISAADLEWNAFSAAWARMQRKYGVPPIGPLQPAPAPDPLPKSLRTSELVIAGVTLTVHHLDDGRRVIERDGLNDLLETMGGDPLSPEDQAKIDEVTTE